MTTSSFHKNRQQGFALIESLIAIVVVALGIFGILGVQMRTLSDTSTTVHRAQAIRLIEDLSERLKVNPNATVDLDAYVTAFSAEPPVVDCPSDICDHAQLAAYDLASWKKSVRDTLKGQASIFVPPAESGIAATQRRQLGVMIAWRENERDTTTNFKDNIDATKVRANNGSLSDGAAIACPAQSICHLQYIPVAGRCLPDANFPGKFFCAGS
ncbi:MAG: type IV pilus modification protein PilV [Giesbergeria sp.]